VSSLLSKSTAPEPRERHNLNDAVFGLNRVNLRFIGNDDIFYGQRIEDSVLVARPTAFWAGRGCR